MATHRRDLLKAGALFAGVSLAGCGGQLDNEATETDAETSDGDESTTQESTATSESAAPAELAVAAEWNVYRALAHDALGLGLAGEFDAGARTAADAFEKFETASGEWGAHEMLESTSEDHYGAFEEALGQLRERATEGNADEMRVEADLVGSHLAEAQTELVGESDARALDLVALASRVSTAGALASASEFEAAAAVVDATAETFADAAAHDALEEADAESYERFETALESASEAVENQQATTVRERAATALDAAVEGAAAVGATDGVAGAGHGVAGAGHVAAMQARGYDAGALASLGGPATDFAHAAALNVYRARAYDAAWLTARGEADRAEQVAEDIFAHFEGAKAHEALEDADHDAYEGFEAGLDDLATAAGNADATAATSAAADVEKHLRAGISALATGTEAAILQAGFFRARFGDARELYALGDGEAAVGITRSLFERFEADELGFHETLEHESDDLYETFEHEHLEDGLIPAFEDGDDDAVETHFAGIGDTLLSFETEAASTARVSAAESNLMSARVFDAAALSALGESERAASVVESAFGHFEAGAGGFHEALEAADHDRYESFEAAIDAAGTAAEEGEAYAEAKQFDEQAVAATYAVVASAGGDFGSEAAAIARDTFAGFEEAAVHELLEEADRDAYEAFESELEALTEAVEQGSGVSDAVSRFARAALRAEFAVVGVPEKAPVGETESDGGESDTELSGGPNVVEGVPDDADHVVEMTAVAFEPAELTVQAGETVAFEHVGGEAHSVTAYEAEDADYWASGDFDSQEAAENGWESGEGAVQSGQSFVHTFETTGTHEYYCIPHEAAGMTGTVVVE